MGGVGDERIVFGLYQSWREEHGESGISVSVLVTVVWVGGV